MASIMIALTGGSTITMKLVALPCEIEHRELHAKLLIALSLTSKYGIHSLIGYDKHFNSLAKHISISAVLDKSCSSILWNGRLRDFKSNGSKILVNDEEGFNGLSEELKQLIFRRVDNEAAQEIDSFGCWGEIDKRFYQSHKILKNKVETIGNARSDLLTTEGRLIYQKEINAITYLYKDYILCSENFALEHRTEGYMYPQFNITEEQKKETTSYQKNIKKIQLQKREIFAELLEKAIRDKPDRSFIIRPHPVSDPRWWQDRFWKYRNVQIIYHLNIEPWLHSASCLISMGCTTSIQAAIAKIPVIELAFKDQVSHGTGMESHGRGRDYTNLVISDKSEICGAINFATNSNQRCFKNLTRLETDWYNSKSYGSSDNIAEILNNISEELDSKSIERVEYVLNDYKKTQKKSRILINRDKWFGNNQSSVVDFINTSCKSLRIAKPRIIPIAEDLYLFSPQDSS